MKNKCTESNTVFYVLLFFPRNFQQVFLCDWEIDIIERVRDQTQWYLVCVLNILSNKSERLLWPRKVPFGVQKIMPFRRTRQLSIVGHS